MGDGGRGKQQKQTNLFSYTNKNWGLLCHNILGKGGFKERFPEGGCSKHKAAGKGNRLAAESNPDVFEKVHENFFITAGVDWSSAKQIAK